MSCYILDNQGNPVVEPDVAKWGRWFETAERHIADDTVGQVRISTVFLALDHTYGHGRPMLYETMVFGGDHNEYSQRYGNRAEALAGHDQAVAMVRDSVDAQ